MWCVCFLKKKTGALGFLVDKKMEIKIFEPT